MSILQGGFGFPCLHPAVYQYIVDDVITECGFFDDIPEIFVQELVDKV